MDFKNAEKFCFLLRVLDSHSQPQIRAFMEELRSQEPDEFQNQLVGEEITAASHEILNILLLDPSKTHIYLG